MADIAGNIKTIKLSNGSVYSIFDNGALRVDPTTHKLITGSALVDQIVLDSNQSIYITEIDGESVAKSYLTYDPENGKIRYQDSDDVLENIGGISYSMADSGVLTFNLGKSTT